VVSQLPDIAGARNGLIGDIRNAVGVAQTVCSQTGQDRFKPVRLKADQIEIETAEFEITQLTAQQIGVPTPPRRKFIIGQAIGLLLVLAPAARDDHRDRYRQPQLCGSGDPAVTGDQHALLVHQNRIGPPPFKIEAAIPSMSAALCSRGLFVYGISFSIGHSSTCSAGHGRVGLAAAARDAIDVIIHLATAHAVRYV
jgi:hypothetical protein